MPTAAPRNDTMTACGRSIALLPPDERRCLDVYCLLLSGATGCRLPRVVRARVAAYLHGTVLLVFKFTPAELRPVPVPVPLQGSTHCIAGRMCHSGAQAAFVLATADGAYTWHPEASKAGSVPTDPTPVPLPAPTGGCPPPVRACSVTHDATAVLCEDGLYTFGSAFPRLGHNRLQPQPDPKRVEAFADMAVQQVALGSGHTAVIAGDRLWTFGCGEDGQLGGCPLHPSLPPVPPPPPPLPPIRNPLDLCCTFYITVLGKTSYEAVPRQQGAQTAHVSRGTSASLSCPEKTRGRQFGAALPTPFPSLPPSLPPSAGHGDAESHFAPKCVAGARGMTKVACGALHTIVMWPDRVLVCGNGVVAQLCALRAFQGQVIHDVAAGGECSAVAASSGVFVLDAEFRRLHRVADPPARALPCPGGALQMVGCPYDPDDASVVLGTAEGQVHVLGLYAAPRSRAPWVRWWPHKPPWYALPLGQGDGPVHVCSVSVSGDYLAVVLHRGQGPPPPGPAQSPGGRWVWPSLMLAAALGVGLGLGLALGVVPRERGWHVLCAVGLVLVTHAAFQAAQQRTGLGLGLGLGKHR